MFQTTRDYLASYITCTGSATIINILLLLLTAAMAVLGYYIVKRLLEIVERIILHSPTDWDDDLIDMRLLKAISQPRPGHNSALGATRLFRQRPNIVPLALGCYVAVYRMGSCAYHHYPHRQPLQGIGTQATL